ARDREWREADAESVHFLLLARRARACGALTRGRSAQRDEEARRHRRRGDPRQAVHRAVGRSRSVDPHLRRAAALQLSAVAARLHRAVHHAGVVARFQPAHPARRRPRLSAPRAALRQSHRVLLMPSKNLVQRIAVATIAIPAVLGIVWLGGWVLAATLALLGVLGAHELYDLGRRQGFEPLERTGWVAAAAIPLLAYWAKGSETRFAEPALYLGAVWLMLALTIAMARRGPAGRPLTSVSVTLFGCL